MIVEEVSLLIAFSAGFLSFFSPCLLPLIPAYISYITGISTNEEVNKNKLFVLKRTLGFVLGFTIIFVLMGASSSFLGSLFIRNQLLFSKLSGILIIIMGLKMMNIINMNFLNLEKRIQAPKKVTNWISSVLIGMAFAAGWTPCFGPILASILVYAGGADTVSHGIYLLVIYSIGMAIPFIIAALFINKYKAFMGKVSYKMTYIPKISGLIMVVFGILIFFDKVVDISRLLLQIGG